MSSTFVPALLFVVASAGLACAGDPPQAPPRADVLALDAIGDALVKARASGQLGKRLLQAKHFVYRPNAEDEDAEYWLLTTRGALNKDGSLSLEVNSDTGSNAGKTWLSYRFSAAGDLLSLERRTLYRTYRTQARGEVKGDRFVVARSGDFGKAAKTEAWRTDVLMVAFATYLLPCVAEFGLPAQIKGNPCSEYDLGGDFSLAGRASLTFSAAPDRVSKGTRYRIYHLQRKGYLVELSVYAQGPREGQLAAVVYEPKSESPAAYRRVDAKAFAKLAARMPQRTNEHHARRLLAGLDLNVAKDGAAPRYTEELVDLQLEPTAYPGYELFLRVSPKGDRWMAVAAPRVLGKTGSRYFAVTSDGDLYVSKVEIPLNDACTLGKGLKRLREAREVVGD